MQKEINTFLKRLKRLNGNQSELTAIIEEWEPILKHQERNDDILRAVFHNIDYAVLVIDAETRSIIHCNPAVSKIFGYSTEEVTGRNTRFLHVDQAHYDRYARESEKVLDRGDSFHTEYPLLKKDGSEFQAEITTTPIDPAETWVDGVVSIIKDVTGEKKKEELEEQHAERVKELECLSTLSELNVKHGYNVEGFIEESVAVIPGSFHYPKATSVRIGLQERECISEDFTESGASLKKEIVVYDEHYGKIEVFVDPEKAPEGMPDFLENEKRVLNIIAERIGRMLERKIENDSLSKKSKHLQAIIDSARDSISLLNDRGEYVDVNPENRRITGYTKQELIGKPVSDIFVGEMKEDFDSAWNELMEKGTLSGEAELERKDGRIITFEYHAVANILPGLHLSINRDITERKAYEEQLEKNLREREVLLREIHHRVKNNLQVIISMINLQIDQLEVPEARTDLEDIQSRIQTIALVYERIHAAENLETVDMNDYLSGLIGALNADAGREVTVSGKIESLQFSIDSAVPCGLIVNELVANSLKHAFPEGGKGTVRVTLGRREGSTVELIVRDDGEGFPENSDFTTPFTLGLSLVRSLAKQLEGEVDFFNDNGAVVRVGFPFPENTSR